MAVPYQRFRKAKRNATKNYPEEWMTRTIPFVAIPAMFNELTPAEIKLLMLYMTTVGGGFSPSARYITRMTGLTEGTIYATRKKLIGRGLVGISENERSLHVNWDALCDMGSKYVQPDNGRIANEN